MNGRDPEIFRKEFENLKLSIRKALEATDGWKLIESEQYEEAYTWFSRFLDQQLGPHVIGIYGREYAYCMQRVAEVKDELNYAFHTILWRQHCKTTDTDGFRILYKTVGKMAYPYEMAFLVWEIEDRDFGANKCVSLPKAHAYHRAGFLKNAIEGYDQVLQQQELERESYDGLFNADTLQQAYLHLGIAHIKLRNYESAKYNLLMYKTEKGKDLLVYYFLGLAYEHLGCRKKAAKEYIIFINKKVKSTDRYPNCWLSLIELRFLRGDAAQRVKEILG